jgi:heme exporter protein B
MLRDARLIAAKDLRIEMVSKVLTTQVVPFGLLVLILFGFAIDPDLQAVGRGVEGNSRAVLETVAPGLFWMAVLFSALLAIGRSFAVESVDGNLDALRLAGLDPSGIFLGKAAAVLLQLIVLEIILGIGALAIYGAPVGHPLLLGATVVVGTVAIAAAGTLYAALAAGLRVRDTLVPLLLLPVLAPVLLGATISTGAALFGPASDGWPWCAALAAFAVLYAAAGILTFGSLLEDS